MIPEALQRNHMIALIRGDLAGAAGFRKRFGPGEGETAEAFLRATVAVCLEPRFGPGAGLGAGPIDFDALAAFMRQIRAAGLDRSPAPDFLAVEAVVRALYGEPHLTEPLTSQAKSAAMYMVLRHQVRAHRWLGSHADTVVDRARAVVETWISA